MQCKIAGTTFNYRESAHPRNYIIVESKEEVFFEIYKLTVCNETITTGIEQENDVQIARAVPVVIGDKQYSLDFQIIESTSTVFEKNKNKERVFINPETLNGGVTVVLEQTEETREQVLSEVSQASSAAPVIEEAVENFQRLEKLKQQTLAELSNLKEQKSQQLIENSQFETKLTALLDNYKNELLKDHYSLIEKAKETYNDHLNSALKDVQLKLSGNTEVIVRNKVDNALANLSEEYNRHHETLELAIEKTVEDTVKKSESLLHNSFIEFSNTISARIHDDFAKLNENTKAAISQKVTSLKNGAEQAYADYVQSLIEEFTTQTANVVADLNAANNDKISIAFDTLQKLVHESEARLNKQVKSVVEDAKVELSAASGKLVNEGAVLLNRNIEDVVKEVQTQLVKSIDIDHIYNSFLKENREILTEKINVFKTKAASKKFEQMIQSEFDKKEVQVLQKVRQLILQFFYTYGSGGGGGGGTTITQSTTGGGPTTPVETPYKAFQLSGLTGLSAVIDSYPLSSFKTAKYSIEVLSGNDVYSSQISIAGNTSNAGYTEFAVLHTAPAPYIEYAALTTGTRVQLIAIASPDLYQMAFKGVRYDPLLS